MTIWEDIKYQFRKGDAILQLVLANVCIFFVVQLTFVPFFLMGVSGLEFEAWMETLFYLPSDLYQLVRRPWTLFTYMFLHVDLLHLLFNMLLLYWFGRILTNLFPGNKVFSLYVMSGLAGGVLFVLAYNLFPAFKILPPIVGASAGVMGIVLAASTQQPRASVSLFLVGRVELQYIALFLVLVDVILIPGGNPGGRIAHLGGAFMGWLFMYRWLRGSDLSRPLQSALAFLSRPFVRSTKAPVRESVRKRPQRSATNLYEKEEGPSESPLRAARGGAAPQPYAGYSRSFAQMYRHLSPEECVDAILDKIRRSGYNSLTEDEKAFLDDSSKNHKR